MPKVRVLLYLAVSSKKQNAPGTISMAEQERLGRVWVEAQGPDWEVIEPPMRIVHSRYYTDMNQWAADMLRDGSNEGFRLFEMWKRRAFDVLWCYAADRLGRRGSMTARMIDETIDANARIYCQTGLGWIDKVTAPGVSALILFSSTTAMQRLREMRDVALIARAKEGRPTSGVIKLAFRRVHGERPEDDYYERIEDRVPMWEALARIVISNAAGTGANKLGQALYDYVDPLTGLVCHYVHPLTGEPWRNSNLWTLLHQPRFWGHVAIIEGKQKGGYPRWVFDETEKVPENVTLFRNVAQPAIDDPVLRAALAEKLCQRKDDNKGSRRPGTTYMFTGLVICDRCRYTMSGSTKTERNGRKIKRWRCHTREWSGRGVNCPLGRYVRDEVVREYVGILLKKALKMANPNRLFVRADQDSQIAARIAALESEIEKLDKRHGQLILDRVEMEHEETRRKYRALIDQIGEQLEAKRAELDALKARQTLLGDQGKRTRSLDKLRALGLEEFWKLPPAEINSWLHDFFGEYRLLSRDGEIVGYDVFSRRKRGMA